MDRTDWKEVRDVIASNGSNKSAGWDGVNCDLVELHSESSDGNRLLFSKFLLILLTFLSGMEKHLNRGGKPLSQ